MKPSCAWTPIVPATRAKKARIKPLSVDVHGKNLHVFWDTMKNQPGAVLGSCWHRGASLSEGSVKGDCLVCAYHGKKTRSVRPTSLAIHQGVLWWNDDLDTGHRDLPHSWEFDDISEHRVHIYTEDFEGCSPLHMVENTVDWKHLAHVHAISAIDGHPDVIIRSPTRADYVYQTKVDGNTLTVQNEFWAPYTTCLRFFLNEHTHLFSLHFAWVPHSRDRCGCIVRVTRSSGARTGKLGDLALQLVNMLPLDEDRRIVRSIETGRPWKDDILDRREDAFLKMYRDAVENDFPEIARMYTN